MRAPRTLPEMQEDANKYARDVFSTTPLHLNLIPEEHFPRTADAIIGALVQAWAAGYAARSEERKR